MSKDTFIDCPLPEDPDRAYELLARQLNARGYELQAIRMPYYELALEFVQIDFPDGTSAYFTLDPEVEEGFRAGPFGGGYSWAVPKYVVKAAADLLRTTFKEDAPA